MSMLMTTLARLLDDVHVDDGHDVSYDDNDDDHDIGQR